MTSPSTAAANAASTSDPTAAPTRVLVVDDNEDNADSLAILLTAREYAVNVAYDGDTAITLATATQPEVILLDIGLAGRNGLEVCASVRRESWGTETTIIAISGWGQASDLQRSLEVGFDAHLVKPVPFHDLVETIEHLRRNRFIRASQRLSREE